MTDPTRTQRPPLGVRLAFGLRKEPDLHAMSDEELVAYREAQNRVAASGAARMIKGFSDRGTTIGWQQLALPDRELPVRVYQPSGRTGRSADQSASQSADPLPLVLHVHGGGFMGTAAQCDWINSHVAARLPAVVVSVEHRLVFPGTPLSAAVDDGWDALVHLVRHADQWGIDPDRVAVVGESAGALIVALAAIRARTADVRLRAQVLVNPCVDLTSTAFDYASMREYADTPTLSASRLELFRQLAVPAGPAGSNGSDGSDAKAVSPLYADDLGGLAPALVVVPTLDPLADHGRTYADRLRAAGTPARLSEHHRAGHAFISMPGLVPAARPARREIRAFLHDHLRPAPNARESSVQVDPGVSR